MFDKIQITKIQPNQINKIQIQSEGYFKKTKIEKQKQKYKYKEQLTINKNNHQQS